jgi:hypothetical protein
MNLDQFTNSLRAKSESEITDVCHAIAPAIESYGQAQMFIWKIFLRLTQTNRPKAAQRLIDSLGWTVPTHGM